MLKIFKFHHDLKCLNDRIKQANAYFLPYLRDAVEWLTIYEKELEKREIKVNFERMIGFNYRTVIKKESGRIEHAEKMLDDLRHGRIYQRRQYVLDQTYYSLDGQQERIEAYVVAIEDTKYDVEEEYGEEAIEAAIRADYLWYNDQYEF